MRCLVGYQMAQGEYQVPPPTDYPDRRAPARQRAPIMADVREARKLDSFRHAADETKRIIQGFPQRPRLDYGAAMSDIRDRAEYARRFPRPPARRARKLPAKKGMDAL
jgi:hypothetical protein